MALQPSDGQRVLLESDLVPYQALAEIPSRAALVLAPHADDEVFGCGGAIAAHVRSGVPVSVIVLTDGAGHGAPSRREQECRAAAQVLGYGTPEFWSYPDRGLRCDEELVQRIVQAVGQRGADLLYAPSPWEVHPDHRQTAAAAREAVRRTGIRVAYYEIGAPLRPNLLLDLTGLAETKARAMQCFASQLEQQDYARQVRALNEYRSYSLPRQVTAAEAYLVLGAADLGAELSARLAALPVSPGAADAVAPQAAAPLVSILVRSVDREFLADALDSIALQTYPNIEVVVAAARPAHRPLPERCGPFPLRLLPTEEPTQRSRTANRALDAARGDYLLFLDDDDWLMPGHIARLAHVLQHQPKALAAYTGVAYAAMDGHLLGQTFDLPFDGVRQLAGNLTPIHSVLFRRQLVDGGCRFDEALDRFEDWDFWLQVARPAPMVHLPGISAVYRLHDSSGVHEDVGPLGAATQLIYQKWQAAWSAGQGAALMQRAWSCADLELELGATRTSLEDHAATVTRLEQEVSAQRHTISQQTHAIADQSHAIALHTEMNAHLAQVNANQAQAIVQQTQMAEQQKFLAEKNQRRIEALLESTSWRVTAPLRWLSSKLKSKA